MQEKRNKLLLITLGALLALTGIAYWLTSLRGSPVVDKEVFKVSNLKDVDLVTLTQAGDSVTLRFTSNRWIVNDTFPADVRMVEVLFATIAQAEPKRPVATSLRDSLARVMEESGVHVSLSAGGTRVADWIASGNAQKTQAYFLDPASNEIYLMTIPGYRVYVSGIFELDESGYRDKLAFPFNWENFRGLTAQYPASPADNFEVVLDKRFFTVQGLHPVDTGKLNSYLDAVSLLQVEQYKNLSTLDSLRNMRSILEISISDIAKRTYTLQVFGTDLQGRTFGIINNTQAAVFQRRRIQPLLRPKIYFRKS